MMSMKTPCPSALVRCTLLASPVNKFAKIVFPVPNYTSPTNKFYPDQKETLSPARSEKLVALTEIEYFQHGLRRQTNSAFSL